MLSQAVGYAISALGFIAATGGKPVLVRVVADACQIPPAYLAKIIHILSRRKLVSTQRGIGGGVVLARPPQEINLRDVCTALGDPVEQPRCMLANVECNDDRDCPAHEFCTHYRQNLLAFLERTTIADIASFEARRRWKQHFPMPVSEQTIEPSVQ